MGIFEEFDGFTFLREFKSLFLHKTLKFFRMYIVELRKMHFSSITMFELNKNHQNPLKIKFSPKIKYSS